MKGTVQSQTAPVFTDRLNSLQQQAGNLAQAYQGGQRQWQIPPGLQGRDLLDVPGLHSPDFDRSAINVNYQTVVQSAANPGTSGDTMALKLQMDVNAVEERAFRFRHASVCRAIAHMHGRRLGHGGAGIFPAMRKQVEDIITAGGQ